MVELLWHKNFSGCEEYNWLDVRNKKAINDNFKVSIDKAIDLWNREHRRDKSE